MAAVFVWGAAATMLISSASAQDLPPVPAQPGPSSAVPPLPTVYAPGPAVPITNGSLYNVPSLVAPNASPPAPVTTVLPQGPQQAAPPTAPPPTAAPPTAAPADPVTPPPVIAGSDSWQPRGGVELRALDKVNARALTISGRVGQPIRYATLSILVRACIVRPPDQAADAAAYLDITDARPNAPSFHGWMFVDEPALAMLEHPIYDIRVSGCRS